MKRSPLFFIILINSLFVFSQNTVIPDSLYGIWESKDRYVFFEKKSENNVPDNNGDEIVIYLKTYYGWYVDRTVEPSDYSEKSERDRNIASPRKADHVYYSIEDIPVLKQKETNFPEKNSVFELNLQYSKNDYTIIPVAIVDDKMYLNFYVRDDDNPDFYIGNAVSEGIKISMQTEAENISCLYFYNDTIFDIRYWLTDMDYENSKVSFTYNQNNFLVDKHIFSAGNNYTCVSGRSKKIRNVVSPFHFQKSDSNEKIIYYIEENIKENNNTWKNNTSVGEDGTNQKSMFFNEDNSILIFDEEPYLSKIIDKDGFEALMQIVKQSNSKRKPSKKPLFPEQKLDWHWDLIDYIEKDDKIIKEVRQRQKEFGLRAKDL